MPTAASVPTAPHSPPAGPEVDLAPEEPTEPTLRPDGPASGAATGTAALTDLADAPDAADAAPEPEPEAAPETEAAAPTTDAGGTEADGAAPERAIDPEDDAPVTAAAGSLDDQTDAAAGRGDTAKDPSATPDVRITIFSEKVDGEGEDAQPLIVDHAGRTYLAVFDGLGGGGAERYVDLSDPDQVRKGAYLASRKARDVLEAVLAPTIDQAGGLAAATPLLGDRIREGLATLADTHQSTSRIVARNKHRFPTTLALVGFDRVDHAGRRPIDVVWCGDSRVFGLHQDHGLLQLTRDHVREEDPADAGLGGDAPMTRLMSADQVALEAVSLEVPAETVLIAATDGCFGYWPSVLHFEQALLATLLDASDEDAWRRELEARILAVTGDDATLALVIPTCHGFAGVRDSFARRALYLDALLTAYDPEDPGNSTFLWERYRREYAMFLPPPSVAPAPAPKPKPTATPPGPEDTAPEPVPPAPTEEGGGASTAPDALDAPAPTGTSGDEAGTAPPSDPAPRAADRLPEAHLSGAPDGRRHADDPPPDPDSPALRIDEEPKRQRIEIPPPTTAHEPVGRSDDAEV